MRIVVIGGVAAGMSAASQAKRRRPELEVIALERGPHVSYGACGIPYNIEDPDRDIEDLVVITPETFRQKRNIDVRTQTEAISIDPARAVVHTKDLQTGETQAVSYDKLVIATGAKAMKPKWPGIDLEGVFLLRELEDGAAVKAHIETHAPKRAVIVGAGYIGMEMADVLRHRGLEVTVLERLPQIIPGLHPSLSTLVQGELERQGVEVQLGVSVEGFRKESDGLAVVTDRGAHPADLVLVAIGVRPNVSLAEEAGVALGESGAIAVDDRMQTNLPNVYAAGDCVEAPHLVSGLPTWVPLGTTANKQGKVAGANAAGFDERFSGIVGTAAFKVFDLQVGRTGLSEAELAALGLEWTASSSTHRSRGNAYHGGGPVHTVLFAERGTGRLLGAQQVAVEGVAGRINVFATALTSQMTVKQIEGLDLAYAPPLAPVYDPILIAATVALKDLARKP